MNIKWNIEKNKGNFRPVLNYEITLEKFEKKLALPQVSTTTKIPVILDSFDRYCLPDCNERHLEWRPGNFHRMYVPSFNQRSVLREIILPYTDNGDFSYVTDSFSGLRIAFERELLAARNSRPVSIRKELGMSSDTRKKMVGDIAAQRMLQVVGE